MSKVQAGTGTGDGRLTTQSDGWKGQRFGAFVLTALIVNGTLYMATKIMSPIEITHDVIYMESIVGIVLVLGRTGVHIAEAWAGSKLGTTERKSTLITEVTKTP